MFHYTVWLMVWSWILGGRKEARCGENWGEHTLDCPLDLSVSSTMLQIPHPVDMLSQGGILLCYVVDSFSEFVFVCVWFFSF